MRWRAWLAIGVTALGLYLVGRWQGFASAAENQAVSNAETALHAGRAYRARIAAQNAFEQKQSAVARTWERRADSLRVLAGRRPGRDTVLVADSSLAPVWRDIADAETHSRKACFASLLTCGQRADSAEARAVVLDSLLRGVLQIHSCHVLFLKCPSRVATGLVMLGVGFAGGLAATHR